MTTVWHMDNLNISHMEKKEVTRIIKRTKSVHGEYMRILRGNKQKYLGMDLNLSVLGEVRVTMVD